MLFGTAHDDLNGHGLGLSNPLSKNGRRFSNVRRPYFPGMRGLSWHGRSSNSLSGQFDGATGAKLHVMNDTQGMVYIPSSFGARQSFPVYYQNGKWFDQGAQEIGQNVVFEDTGLPVNRPSAPAPVPTTPPPPVIVSQPAAPVLYSTPAGYSPLTYRTSSSFGAGGSVESQAGAMPWSSQPPQTDGTYPGGTVWDTVSWGEMSGSTVVLDKNVALLNGYAYKSEDVGAIYLENGRLYELYKITLVNVATGQTWIYYSTREGGSPGTLLNTVNQAISRTVAPIAGTLIHVLTDVGTGGASELVGVVSDKGQTYLEDVVGGSSVGGATGAASGFVTSGFNPYGAIAGAVAGAVAGTVAGAEAALNDQSATDVVTNSIIGGTVSGAVAGVAVALMPPTTPVPDVTGEALTSGASDTGQSLLAPNILTGDPTATFAVEGAKTASQAAAGGTFTLPPSVLGAGSVVTKAVTATLVSGAATALATQIKKMTGQLPGGHIAPPSQSLTINSPAVTGDVAQGAAKSSGISTVTKWALGGVAALALFKKHAA